MTTSDSDVLVIGGGFYGCVLALHLARQGRRVRLLERDQALLRYASTINQARVHNGYHYPRAILTALRSRINYPNFTRDYADCLDDQFEAYYAVARQNSKVTAQQFRTFCARIEAPLGPAPVSVRRLFNEDLIEDVFAVTECVFDAAKLAARMARELTEAHVDVRFGHEAMTIQSASGGGVRVQVRSDAGESIASAAQVYLCGYAWMNGVLERSGLPRIALKQEITEMALMEMPAEWGRRSITVMCGPFFSIMPFPPRAPLFTLSHVRYTPHATWREGPGQAPTPFTGQWPATQGPYMVKDAARYLPLVANAHQRDSLWAIKTVLPASETDDSRPILFLRDHGVPGLTCILGGKIDNVYDMMREVDCAAV